MAVYTDVSAEELTAFIAEYDIGETAAFRGIAEGVENSNYLLQTDTGTYILTLFERRTSAEDLPYFLGLMEHLAAKGIPCPTPIHGRDGNVLRRLCDRPATIVSFLPGMWPRRITTSHCAQLGGALARMHIAGADYSPARPNGLSLDGWLDLLANSRPAADDALPGIVPIITDELGFLADHWPEGLPVGIIHADLFPDNVFFQDGSLSGLIDFYFACNDFFAYDLAICLNAWCFEPDGSFNITKARQMLSNYRNEREFSAAELAALPILARGSALRFLLTRLYDWIHHSPDALVKRKDPREYLMKLRFHQGVDGPQAYGLDS